MWCGVLSAHAGWCVRDVACALVAAGAQRRTVVACCGGVRRVSSALPSALSPSHHMVLVQGVACVLLSVLVLLRCDWAASRLQRCVQLCIVVRLRATDHGLVRIVARVQPRRLEEGLRAPHRRLRRP